MKKNNSSAPKFAVNDKGVFYFDDGEEDVNSLWVCSKLEIKALVRDKSSENWGRLLEFYDADKKLHRWSMPMEMLKGGGEELRSELLRLGLNISPHAKARNLLTRYIMDSTPETRARCIWRTGWYEKSFVFPDKTIGQISEQVLYQSETIVADYKESGTLQEWQDYVSKLCVGNSRLVLSVSIAFAAMLLYLVGHESGGIHFVGESSTGKTTALRVAASVYGGADYLNRWRATTNGLEALAAIRSDTLLILDELSQVDPREAGEIAYMLANGSGKSRANRNGNTRIRHEWRLLFLSAGEIGLAQHLASTGKRIKAGQEVRLVDIPADAGTKLGIFEDLHGYESGALFSKVLMENTQKYYGTGVIGFLETIAVPAQWEENTQFLKSLIKSFLEKHLPKDSSGQVNRVCERFALIAAAGELASLYGVTGWRANEAEESAARCFKDWLEQRGTNGNHERSVIIAQFKKFFEIHGESRFTEFNNEKDSLSALRTSNRAGFKRKVAGYYEYYLFSEIYRSEIFSDFDSRAAAKILAEEGLIEPENDKNLANRVYLPGLGQTRCYKVLMRNWERKLDELNLSDINSPLN
jgi:putative DNA primase/helicase